VVRHSEHDAFVPVTLYASCPTQTLRGEFVVARKALIDALRPSVAGHHPASVRQDSIYPSWR
jgi:hypothetical protein